MVEKLIAVKLLILIQFAVKTKIGKRGQKDNDEEIANRGQNLGHKLTFVILSFATRGHKYGCTYFGRLDIW